ncbi:MAG: type II secretion system protein GspD [Kiritimatiellae bacterium]|nr:type II secretion system protein GspD [Kiritimatiellia bacterium]
MTAVHTRFSLCLAALMAGTLFAGAQDPTMPSERMAESLKARAAATSALRLKALVVGVSADGVALIGTSALGVTPERRGTQFAESVDGVSVTMKVRAIGVDGVEIETSRASAPLFLPGSFQSVAAPTNQPAEFVRYVEATEVPLEQLLRLLADQTGVNISASERAARNRLVSLFLRNVTVSTAVEELCRATGLWFQREKGSNVIRVTTMEEYAENLSSFREEKTETFTLLYPNVVEAAGVIYGLYPDRTLLSLGEEEVDEDAENDLSRRFRRFQMISDNGGSSFLKMEPPDANTAAGGRSGSGTFSYSRGSGAQNRRSQWDWLRSASRLSGLTPAEAKRVETAFRQGDTNLFEKVYGRNTAQAANIFVTVSRRNNLLIVRSSDAAAMDAIRELVKRIDVPTPMVLLEMKVLELDVDDAYNATFQYSFNTHGTHKWGSHAGRDGLERVTPSGDGDASAQTLVSPLQGLFSPAALNPVSESTLAFSVLSDTLNAQLQLMAQDGKVRTLATPAVLTANNEVSRIFSGAEYPIVKGVTAGETTTTEAGFVTHDSTVQLEWVDVGTMLLVTPSINADKTVTLHVVQENSEIPAEKVRVPLDGGKMNETTPIDIVESRSLAGTFVAKDGMTVMAGGLIKETWKEVYTRTPVLGSIPLVGFLFRGTEKQKKRTELIVLIKPHVISTPMEGGRISRELMEALSAHPAADGRPNMGIHFGNNPTNNVPRAVQDARRIVE